MPTKASIKKRSSHPYEKATGQVLYKLEGELNCQIAPVARVLFSGKQYRVGAVAVSQYLNTPVTEVSKVIHTCGIKNCVLPSHLMYRDQEGRMHRVSETENKEDVHKEVDAPDDRGEIHGVQPDVWESLNDYQRQQLREGKVDHISVHYNKAPRE